MESRVSLTACELFIVNQLLEYFQNLYRVCVFMGLIWSFANGFKYVNCSTQLLRNAKKVGVAWRSMLVLRQSIAFKFSSKSNLHQQAASH